MQNQKPLKAEDHIQRLKSRGMIFLDETKAKDVFSYISYFRLKYYWKDMYETNEELVFVNNTFFETVVERYNFDRQLRLVLFDAIEMIEVALRTKIINYLSQKAGNGIWYIDYSLFNDAKFHFDFVIDLKHEFNRSSEPFAKEYIVTHQNWDYESFNGDNPDAWMIFESATFGTLSKMYKNLKNQLPECSKIANDFGLYSVRELSSWLESISVLRNIIAHHSRLWNRTLSKQPSNIKGHKYKWLSNPLTHYQSKKPYGVITAMLYLCDSVCPNNNIREKILSLISENPRIPIQTLGFVGDWQNEPIWQN